MRVLLGIVLVVAFLLLCSVRIRATYREFFSLKLSYLFFSYTVFPQKKKKTARKRKTRRKKQTQKKPEENIFKRAYREKGLVGFLRLLQGLAKAASTALRKILPHVRVRRLSVNVVVATADAADTAITYGLTCSVVYPAVAVLVASTRCRRYDVAVTADFDAEESRIDAAADIKVRVLFVIVAALYALFQYMKARKSATINTEVQTNERKGGAET